MPCNGEVNTKFGVYKSLCCGIEIVVPEGIAFPDCPAHFKLSTSWKHISDGRIRHVSELLAQPERKHPAA